MYCLLSRISRRQAASAAEQRPATAPSASRLPIIFPRSRIALSSLMNHLLRVDGAYVPKVQALRVADNGLVRTEWHICVALTRFDDRRGLGKTASPKPRIPA